MAFDPTKPANDAPIVSAELRAQFAGLKDLIDAVPASPAMAGILSTQTAGSVADVPELVLTINNPPTQLQVQAIVERFNALLEALKRV